MRPWLWLPPMLALGCGSAAVPGVPPMSQLDALTAGALSVAAWCQKNGIEPETVISAGKALAEKDYAGAYAMLADAVARSRAAGTPIPAEVETTLRLAEGALAAKAIQEGMGAVSK